MNCGMAEGTELHFLSSGIRILPNKVEYESDNTNYDYARVDITRQAGDYLKNNAIIPEPVEIHTGGRKLCDVYFGKDSLTLDKNEAYLELLDARKVLEKGIVDKKFHSVTLGGLIDWFRTEVEKMESGDVFTGVELVNVDATRETESLVQQSADINSPDEEGQDVDDMDGVQLGFHQFKAWLGRGVRGLTPKKEKEEGGLDFNQASLSQVLAMIEEEFGLQSYVDENRVLKIGHPEVEAELYYAGSGPNMWYVNEYNLTTNPSDVQLISIKGGNTKVRRAEDDPTTSTWENRNTNHPKTMRWWAFASTEPPRFNISDEDVINEYKESVFSSSDGPEGRVVTLNHKSTDSKSTLYNLAVRRMIQEMINKVSGSIVVQPAKSSVNLGWPQNMKVGDSIAVFPGSRQPNCVDKIEENLFVVTGISHSIDGKNGWEMELQLSRTPRKDIFVAAMPWPKIPEQGSDFEDYRQFYEKAMKYDNGSYFRDMDGDGEQG